MQRLLDKISLLTEKVEDWSKLPVAPLVSVYMITYNHEKFIAQALEGILMQELSFPHEIVIGEDKSTDRTREIVCEYQHRHPDKIRLHLSKENLNRQKMAGYGPLNACRGKYIAMCEGDDYWTDPLKLQKQAELMEAEPGLSGCFTNAAIENESGAPDPSVYLGDGPPRSLGAKRKQLYLRQEDIVEGLLVPSCTAFMRTEHIRELPDWILRVPTGDWGIAMVLTRRGPLKYLDEITAVYRRHSGGTWSSLLVLDKIAQGVARMDVYRPYADPALVPVLDDALRRQRHELRRHGTGLLAMWLNKDGLSGFDSHEKQLAKYFGGWERRQIRLAALERFFQQAYFKNKPGEARQRLLALMGRHPEWLLRKGSLGQAVRTLAGRI